MQPLLTVLLRIALVALAGIVAGSAAWLAVRGQPEEYERTLTFLLRPGASLSDAQIPDAVRGLSQQDAQLVNTIGGALGTDRFLRSSLAAVGVEAAEGYSARSSVVPGSDIVEVHLRGSDPDDLAEIGQSYRRLATDWVSSVYRAYSLDFLEEEASPGPVAPRTAQVVSLATLLGLLLAVGVVFAERKARQRLAASATLRRRVPGGGLTPVDGRRRFDQLEEALRSSLGPTEDVIRDGPELLRVVGRGGGHTRDLQRET
jgi:hypothetical protein